MNSPESSQIIVRDNGDVAVHGRWEDDKGRRFRTQYPGAVRLVIEVLEHGRADVRTHGYATPWAARVAIRRFASWLIYRAGAPDLARRASAITVRQNGIAHSAGFEYPRRKGSLPPKAGEPVVLQACNARGWPVGMSHPFCKYPDEAVALARQLHAGGTSYKEIAAIIGCAVGTAWGWVRGGDRPDPAQMIVRRGPRQQCNGLA